MLLRRFGDRSPRGRRDSLRHPAGVTRRMAPPSGREASGRRGRRPLRRERNARAGRDAFIAPFPPALTFHSSLFPLPSSFLRQGGLSGKRPLSLPGGRQLPLTGEPKRNGAGGATPQSWRLRETHQDSSPCTGEPKRNGAGGTTPQSRRLRETRRDSSPCTGEPKRKKD